MDIVNDHNVYILGAGFSAAAGLPLIDDFLLRMRDSHEWLLQHNRIREATAVEAVLNFRLSAASASYWVTLDLENIEELFSLASAGAGGISADIRLAIAATLDYARTTKGLLQSEFRVHSSKIFNPIAKQHPNWVKFDSSRHPSSPSEGWYHVDLYAFYVARLLGMFQDGKPKGQNTFITFNYDSILEEALAKLELPIAFGSDMKIHDKFAQQSGQPIPVLKLHGSVNWARSNSETGLEVFNNYSQVVEKNLTPELVPPTWKKVFERQLESIWETAIKQLRTATRVIIVGFSMPPADMHFKYLLAAGLQSNVSLRHILFVNPRNTDEIQQRARNLLRNTYIDSQRISFSISTFEGFANFQGSNGPSLYTVGRPIEYGASYELYLP